MNVYFIAIGGSVMHNLAIALKLKGHQVTGSDDEIFEPAKSNLAKFGLLPEKEGWDPVRITKNIDAIVLGMHAKNDNPELLCAMELGLKIYSYPEFLYEQSKDKLRVVIGGSHGKTSITAMILHILKKEKFDADYMIGASLAGYDLTVRLSDDAPVMIFEGDEYPDSSINVTPKFLMYKADVGLISGIAWDHINVFPTFENYVEQFRRFALAIPDGGALVYNEEDETVLKIAQELKSNIRKIPYSTPPYQIENGITYLIDHGKRIPLKIFGKHNLQNLAGAIEICKLIGIGEEDSFSAIQDFSGATRRLELLSHNEYTAVFKDFAHSPSKLKATIAAVKQQYPSRKLVACLELHTFSSLNKNFLKEYHGGMDEADIKIIFYNDHTFALKRMEPLDPIFVKEAFGDATINVITDKNKLDEFLHMIDWKNTNLLMMSSGNFDGLDLKELSTFATQHT